MGTTFQSIITEFDNDFTRKILGQSIFHKCEFWDCSFENCQINQCQFTKADFYTNIFDHSYLQKIDSSWSYFGTCSFYKTDISDIDFTGAIIDNLTFNLDLLLCKIVFLPRPISLSGNFLKLSG